MIFFVSILANAQEAKYKQALDSIAYYIKFTQIENQTHLLTHYNNLNTKINTSEVTARGIYLLMAYNYKTKVVFTDGNIVYMIDFKQIDTTFFSITRKGLRISDPAKKVMFMHSNTVRLSNGKIGGVPVDQIDLEYPISTEANTYSTLQKLYNLNKLIYFLKQAALYSKKIKTKKKDIVTAQQYE